MLAPIRFVMVLLTISLASLAPLVAATPVSEQFRLSTVKDGSKCFLLCHNQAVRTTLIPGRNVNLKAAITPNCQNPVWRSLISVCLPTMCISAPDLVYAIEYGERFCRRAGVADVKFELPQWFLETDGGLWYNETVVASVKRSAAERLAVDSAWVLPAGIVAAVISSSL